MIDNRRFSRGADLDEDALRDVTVRRLKGEIESKNFKTRSIDVLPFTPSEDEQEHFETLDRILRQSKKLNGREQGGDLVAMLLKKRFLSSPYSFGRTLSAFVNSHGTPGASLSASLFDDDDEVLREVVGSEASDEEEGLQHHPEYLALQQRKAVSYTHLDVYKRQGMNRSHAEVQVATAWGYFLPHLLSVKMSSSVRAASAVPAV